MNERPIPPAAQTDSNAFEVLRVWIADKALQTSLLIGAYKDHKIAEEDAWGIILADTARHIAKGLSEQNNGHPATFLDRITRSFIREVDDPTTEIEGGFIH